MEDKKIKTGTTTLGVIFKDGVILASDAKASMGHLAYDEETKKIYQIGNTIGMTIAGSVGDALAVVRFIKSHVRLFEIEREDKITVKGVSTFLSNILNSNRYYPFLCQFIIGGYVKKPALFDLDPSGGLLERTKYAVTGSGTELALVTLDNLYKEGLNEKEAREVALKAILAAKRRDNYSGGFIVNFMTIKKGELKEERLSESDVSKYIKSK